MLSIERSDENPILLPNSTHPWEDLAAFNGSAIKEKRTVHLLYRALGHPELHGGHMFPLSIIGHAKGTDGIHFGEHTPFIEPEYPWEQFGCEDPRVTKCEDTYYIFYTALSTFPFGPDGIRVGVALSKDLKTIESKHPVTHFNSKAMTLFPEKINGKFYALLSVNTDRPPSSIALVSFDKQSDIWSREHWDAWYSELGRHALNLRKEDGDHVEIGSAPIKTKEGWLLIYSHIYKYGTADQVFGIEAILLDLENPHIILGRTSTPLLVPQEEYEEYGMVPNIVFPSGAYIEKDSLHIYYGAADTTVCRATVSLKSLLKDMLTPESTLRFVRHKDNPILLPDPSHAWEDKAVFNPAIVDGSSGKLHLVYRAMGHEDTSVMGYAELKNETEVALRLPDPIYVPREAFESKYHPGNSGCEDPRITRIDDTYYLCYTAFDGNNPPRVALSTISVSDFEARRFEKFSTPILISRPGIDDKDAALFPEKINDEYVIIHRIQPSIDINTIESLDFFDGEHFLTQNPIMKPRPGMWDDLKIGLSSTPLKTRSGWLLLYHGVSSKDHHYRVGAALLDLSDPTKVIGRTKAPLFEPEEPYEKVGVVPNVVFPCGAIIVKKKLFIYYGGADTVIGVASLELEKLLKELEG